MYYVNNNSVYLINVFINTVIWKQKTDWIASGTSLRGMAKQPGSTAYLHQSEAWKAEQAVTVLPTATEKTRDTTVERVADPLPKTSFPHHLYTKFK